MDDAVLILPPASEPVTVDQAKVQLRLDPGDSDEDDFLAGLVATARVACEDYARRVFITQRWQLRMEGFPGKDWRYNWNGYPAIVLPKPPFQSIDFVKYVDTFGQVQDLPLDTTYGNGAAQYGYQLVRGGETAPARLLSAWARPWPPTRMVPGNVMVQFRCGYGELLTVSMDPDSAVLTAPVTFNADDAPLMIGGTGLPVTVKGAGPDGTDLKTFIASVDESGVATLKAAASTPVTDGQAWAGHPLPPVISQAILIAVDYLYEHRGETDAPLPQAAKALLDPYRNLVA
jgi:uncharacterized phiE125 gp8 family phage protein